MKNGLLLFIALGIQAAIFAQDSTLVRWYIKGGETFFIRLNGELLPENNVHKIAQGNYKVEIYSPTFKLHTGDFSTDNKLQINYVAEMQFDDAYRDYLSAYEGYKKRILARQTLPALAGTLGIISAPIFYFKAKSSHEAYIKQRFLNNYLPLEQSTQELKSRYITNQSMFAITGALAATGISTFFLMRKKTSALKKPIYRQENPFTLEQFRIGYLIENNSPLMGLTLNF